MSKLGYRRSTHNGSKLIPLSLSASSFSTITPPTTSFSTFETLHKVHSNPQDLFIKPSPKDSRTIRRVNSASLLTNVHLRPRTPSISALPDSPSWVSSRDRKYSQDSTSSLLTASIDRRRRDSESGLWFLHPEVRAAFQLPLPCLVVFKRIQDFLINLYFCGSQYQLRGGEGRGLRRADFGRIRSLLAFNFFNFTVRPTTASSSLSEKVAIGSDDSLPVHWLSGSSEAISNKQRIATSLSSIYHQD